MLKEATVIDEMASVGVAFSTGHLDLVVWSRGTVSLKNVAVECLLWGVPCPPVSWKVLAEVGR